MPDLTAKRFCSADGRFDVVLEPAALDAMIAACVTAGRKETGGILIGRHADGGAAAIVTEATAKPKGSSFGWFWFTRGTRGLAALLKDRWERGEHYLGEWHFHPGASPAPSATDLSTMTGIAADEGYQCREPILAIIGGRPPADWALSVTVLPVGETPCSLRGAC